MTNQSYFNNEGEFTLCGSFDLSAAAAVLATAGAQRGSNFTFTKTGTGLYTAVMKQSGSPQLVEVLFADAGLSNSATRAGALEAQINSVVQSATTGDITITIQTCAETGVAADTTATITVNFLVKVRIFKMGNPL